MEKFFGLKESKTTVRTEFIAGITTFFTMAYIIFVNPAILSLTGMSKNGVFIATILSSIIGTLILGLVANVPYAAAPGMGLNAFFTYTVCWQLGFEWQEALAMVFICGLINVIVTVTKFRKAIIKSIPKDLQHAISGGIGLFIAYIGIKNAGFLKFIMDPGTYVAIGEGADQAEATIIGSSATVPALVNFSQAAALLALIGLIITVILMVAKVPGYILIGIVLTTIIGLPLGVTIIGNDFQAFSFAGIGALKDVSFSFFGEVGFKTMFSNPERIALVVITVFSFSLSDTFDTIGTFVGTGRRSGIFDEADEKALEEGGAFKSKMDKALFADSTATSIGALLGTSNATTYVESAAGIGVGGRTGLTSVAVALCFLLCLPFSSVIGIVPAAATAPALIIVGILMAESLGDIDWKNIETAIPAFMTMTVMTFAFNISYGIAAGFIFFVIVKLCRGKIKEIHPILFGAAILFLLNFIILAVKNL